MRKLLLAALLGLPMTLSAAINPQHYVDAATDHLQLREISRVVQYTQVGEARHRRVTLVGEVVADRNTDEPKTGRIIVIDYTVDLTERARAAKAHADRMGNMPGPQFLGEPDPPKPGADGLYWAHVAPVGDRVAWANRNAGAVVAPDEGQARDEGDYQTSGEVYVPVSAQYSFET